MLPLPGSPSSSWATYRMRLRTLFQGADPRVCAAFWLFGVINNVLYVIILSAALDLVGPRVPKGVVLLADVMPSFLIKLIAPYFIHTIPYHARVIIFVSLSVWGMLLVALTSDARDTGAITMKMAGVILASISSGGGELSFLGLTHYYGHFSLASWASGTGGAGLIGAGAYLAATTWAGWSVRNSLLVFSCLPVIMLLSFFLILPGAPLRAAALAKQYGYEGVPSEEEIDTGLQGDDLAFDAETLRGENGVLGSSTTSASSHDHSPSLASNDIAVNFSVEAAWLGFKSNLRRSRHLFFPYMLPLLLVYIAEYTINQGVAPTLLFPLPGTPFSHYRSFYPTYNALYQTGVFISRSSSPFFRVHHLYVPSLLQCVNLVLLMLHALFDILPNVYWVFAIVFWEGLLGGLVYVSTFAEITDSVRKEDREFSLGATSVSDSGGICIAGFLGMAVEVWLCDWQVARGRDFCHRL
ncbi:MAG: battenin CLN3 protein [Sclerophora amabilis]|nr:MAG: battenin CLN3 protein [Sclerophora amabilis]